MSPAFIAGARDATAPVIGLIRSNFMAHLLIMLFGIAIKIAMFNSIIYITCMKDSLATLPGYALRRASAAMMAEFNQRLVPLGFRFTEASVLMAIADNPGITQSDIGRALDIQRANMAPLVARLEDRGMVARTRVDGRSHGLTLTAAGVQTIKAVRAAVDAHETALMARVPVEARGVFLEALNALWQEPAAQSSLAA
jgi:DNA-binding MarR family transcriptional regulator